MPNRTKLLDTFMKRVEQINEGEAEFLQAVEDVAADVLTIEKNSSAFTQERVMERLTMPDRVISFRVAWEDDAGNVQLNSGYRVQMSNALGPYKGGIRFHPSVTPSILKFLAFEQVFKNSLTGLPLGGGKGGADFDPKGKSDREIMRFCQAFMGELSHHIGPDRDVPAGDIGVGTREIGYLFGAYKSSHMEFNGALTGKGFSFGGSQLRIEATGYGLIYFLQCMLAVSGQSIDKQRIAISGMGNVALHAAEKAICEGGTVISLSNSSGTLHARDGFSRDALEWVKSAAAQGADIAGGDAKFGLSFEEARKPWGLDATIALPCATQNEFDADDARAAIDAGLSVLAEGANMPLTADAARELESAKINYAPGKASNAGGVAISGIEMSQNAHRRFMSKVDVDDALKTIMQNIHDAALRDGRERDAINYHRGANIAAYRKVAEAISAYGIM